MNVPPSEALNNLDITIQNTYNIHSVTNDLINDLCFMDLPVDKGGDSTSH
jgi:hypothetical protein